jgi:FAD/FMN-containing dehydrogenase
MATQLRTTDALPERLAAIVGAAHVLTDAQDLAFYSTDVFSAGKPPVAVVRPGTIDELQAIVRLAYETASPLVVRGGGASYTDGYLHTQDAGITLDTARLKAIRIDAMGATVTVEPGVTWAELREALAPHGLRSPFQGPFSGLAATIAGSISQNSVSHGPGVSAEAVLTLEIITGTGDRLATGSAGSSVPNPFFRHFGPDLAGLFTGDCGALGVKALVTLKLVRRHEAFDAGSFNFATFEAMHEAMRLIALEAVDDTNFGLDSTLQQGQIGRNAGVGAKADIAINVMKSASSLGAGVKSLARMAMAGDKALKAATYAVHYISEGVDDAEARAKMGAIRRIATAHGEEIPNSVPTVVRGMPFAPLTNTLGPKGERWVPMHTLLSHAAALPFHTALQAYWAENADAMAAHHIHSGTMFMAVGQTGFIYEPTFYWHDAQSIFHERMVPADHLSSLPRYAASAAGREEVERMKHDVIMLMHAHGGAHFQIGKVYPYLDGRNPASVALLRAIKSALDPRNILNPGALGL